MGEVIRKMKDGKFVGWYIRFVDADGKRKQRASKQPSAQLARRMLAEIEARIARGKAGIVDEAENSLTVRELFAEFLKRFSSPRIKDLARYRERLASVLRRIENQAPHVMLLRAAELRQAHVASIRDALSRKYPAGTVRTSLAGLSAAFSWALREGLIERHPCRGVEQPPPPLRTEEWLTAEEIGKVLAEAARRGETSLKWASRHVAIALGVYLGLRRGEIFGLRWRDVDLTHGRVTVARSYESTPKNGKARHVKLPTGLVPILTAWRPRCPSTVAGVVCPALGTNGWQLLQDRNRLLELPNLLEAAGVKQVPRPWHGLRHSFASNFLLQGGSVLALQKILGHSKLETTMVYAHLSAEFVDGSIERLKY